MFNKFQSLSFLCVECDLLNCTCARISQSTDKYDDQDGIECNSTISELLKDESIHFNRRTMPFEENFVTDEQFETQR